MQSRKSSDTSTCVCVIGVGYVGLSLLGVFGRHFQCIGFDISEKRIKELRSQQNFDGHDHKIELTTDEALLSRGTHYLISVPTLLHGDLSINLDYVKSAIHTVTKYARPRCCIVIESSVAVGTTRTLLGPYMRKYHCGMSPERIDPGRTFPAARDIPKIVSGLTESSLKQINALYSQAFTTTVPVSSTDMAEMCKNAENCQRMVMISYVNEISDACEEHGIDVHEMLAACDTKPFGYSPYQPGLGVGGHCIPVNPYYLMANNKLPVLETATKRMLERPIKKARKIYAECINNIGRQTPLGQASKPRVLVVGLAFKPGQSDTSGSPGLSLSKEMVNLGCARIAYYDPLVSQSKIPWIAKLEAADWNQAYIDTEFDVVVACNKQKGVDFSVLQNLDRAMLSSFFRMDSPKPKPKQKQIISAMLFSKSPVKNIRFLDTFGVQVLRPIAAQI